MEPLTHSAALFFDPLLIQRYRCNTGGGTAKHQHPSTEPCHITILAAGSVRVEVFDQANQLVRSDVFTAPAICDYSDGRERHHRVVALEDGTVFFNVPRVVRPDASKFVAEELAAPHG